MKLKAFTLSFSQETGGFDDASLRKFLEDKDVETVHQHAFEYQGRPYWAILVKYEEKNGAAVKPAAGADVRAIVGRGPSASPASPASPGVPPKVSLAPAGNAAAPGKNNLPAGSNGRPPNAPAPAARSFGTAPKTNGSAMRASGASVKPPAAPQSRKASEEVFETLRRWRFKLSKARGIPPYLVCLNKELDAIVREMPADRRSLIAIRDIRPAVAEMYGAEILEVLRRIN